MEPNALPFFSIVKNYWFLAVLAFGVIVTYADNDSKHTEFERRMVLVEAKADRNDITFLQLQKDIVEIKTSLEYIKTQVQKQ